MKIGTELTTIDAMMVLNDDSSSVTNESSKMKKKKKKKKKKKNTGVNQIPNPILYHTDDESLLRTIIASMVVNSVPIFNGSHNLLNVS